jgi:hypothetical protein
VKSGSDWNALEALKLTLAASLAVLPFEPHPTMPPSNAATAATITAGSNRIAPKSIAARTMLPPAKAIREARMNLRQLSILAASSSMCASRRTISSCGSPSPLGAYKVCRALAHLNGLTLTSMLHREDVCIEIGTSKPADKHCQLT